MRDDTRASLTALVEASQQAWEIKREFDRLNEIEQWALGTLHLTDGDAAVITQTLNTDNGWACSREVLVPGCTGIVSQFWLSGRSGGWCGLFVPDVQWTVNDTWGRRKETRPAAFMLPLRVLRKRTDDDTPLVMPDDAKDWGVR